MLRHAARIRSTEVPVQPSALDTVLHRAKRTLCVSNLPKLANGMVLVSRAVLKELLAILNIQEMQDKFLEGFSPTIKPLHKRIGPAPIGGRLKALNPAAIGSLRALHGPDGKVITHPSGVEKEVRRARAFWTQTPAEVDPDLLATLPQ